MARQYTLAATLGLILLVSLTATRTADGDVATAFAIRSGTVGATLSQALAKLRAAQAARRLVRGAMRP